MREFVPLFDGESLAGEQDTPGSGYGGYLVSDQAFGDFELVLEMRPDWPADTGVMIRRQRDSWEGFQVLVDHRPSGGIGGFFGNGLASFSAVPFAIDAVYDDDGRPVGLVADDPATSVEPVGVLGSRGHIALEVHDNDAMFGEARWGKGAQCRWRNIRIRELDAESERNAQ